MWRNVGLPVGSGFRLEPQALRWRPWLLFARWVIGSPIMWLLLTVNIGGAVAGYIFWYGDSLSAAPFYLWPFVPDSPLSVTLMGFALLLFHFNRRLEFLGLLAAGMCMKYGIWTDFVWFTDYLAGGEYHFVAVLMSLTHFGMVIQGFILSPYLRFRPVHALLAALFLVVNDVVDYVFGYHPPLPNPEDLGGITAFSLATTAAIVAFWAFMVLRPRRSA
jgi:uncharacterized membrane protein YpjA